MFLVQMMITLFSHIPSLLSKYIMWYYVLQIFLMYKNYKYYITILQQNII